MQSLQFSKNFPLPKNGGHFEFSNFGQKWQNTNLLLSPKIFPSPKMAAILNFQIFAKNGKTQICFYLLNRASIVLLLIFKKFSPPQKWRPF